MESAITASTGACDSRTTSKADNPRVMLCATVNAVMVFTSGPSREMKNIRPMTNRMWSMPNSRCSMPSTR